MGKLSIAGLLAAMLLLATIEARECFRRDADLRELEATYRIARENEVRLAWRQLRFYMYELWIHSLPDCED